MNKERRRGRSQISLAELLEAGVLASDERLRLQARGSTYWATITADGGVNVAGRTYPSLSAAAAAIVPYAVNGWRGWNVRRDGSWLSLAEVRNRYLSDASRVRRR